MSNPVLLKGTVLRISRGIGVGFRQKPLGLGGGGYLAGEFPDGITTVEGVPTAAEVRVLWRGPAGARFDGVVVAHTVSAPDGTWRVDGLNPALRFDVVGRLAGRNDVIMANVAPEV